MVLTQVLSGGGGVGKTQLAAAYAHQALADGVELVVWVDASESEQVTTRYAQAAYLVNVPGFVEDESAIANARAFLHWLAVTPRSWLVILDDITDPDAMQPWWPPPSASGRGRVLATTRRHDAILSGGGRAVVNIETYSAEEADTYLRERLTTAHAAHLLDTQANTLAKTLGYLPLALSHAAAYMINEDVPCADYLHRFTHSSARLDELFPRHADTEGYGRQVAAALLLSLDVAQTCEPVGLAIPALRLAAMLDPAGHPRSLWAGRAVIRYLNAQRAASSSVDGPSAVDPSQARAVLRLLHRYGLIVDDAQAGSRAVRLHALTARAMREYTPGDALPNVVKTAADALTELWLGSHRHERDESAVVQTNIDSLEGCAGDLLWEVGGHHLLRWSGRSLIGHGLASAAVPYWQRLTATSERLLGRAHPKTLLARRELAMAYLLDDRDQDAFALLREDFPYREQILEPDHPETIRVDKPTPLYGCKSIDDAIALLEDTLAVRERLLGREDPTTIACRANLAIAYWRAGKTLKATSLLERVLADREKALGTRHPDALSAADRPQRWRGLSSGRWWNRWRKRLRARRPAPDPPRGPRMKTDHSAHRDL
ncbi:tetratricopeptide repeat-containing protein [Streptomyces sp. Ru73]|uniref:tetratricopeptide repeat-containing protein n=1 Tax=Streptomyces sp. Ru73 TaxID=2080748 RepID=UPI0021565305|nr:tetratricopeptide repeat-containing protein [Streptomyces sp. Ru73]